MNKDYDPLAGMNDNDDNVARPGRLQDTPSQNAGEVGDEEQPGGGPGGVNFDIPPMDDDEDNVPLLFPPSESIPPQAQRGNPQ